MDSLQSVRQHVLSVLSNSNARADFRQAVADFPAEQRGAAPPGVPHSGWQLLEHLRIAQRDILEFSRNPKHVSPEWPKAYWPSEREPPSEKAWFASITAFERDAEEFQKLIADTSNDLTAPF